MAVSEEFVNYIQGQLETIDLVTYKRMFGGVGVFYEGKMFGLISSQAAFYLKVSDANRTQFEASEMPKFNPGNKPGKGMPYYQVPPNVLEDKALLKEWALQSVEIAIGG